MTVEVQFVRANQTFPPGRDFPQGVLSLVSLSPCPRVPVDSEHRALAPGSSVPSPPPGFPRIWQAACH